MSNNQTKIILLKTNIAVGNALVETSRKVAASDTALLKLFTAENEPAYDDVLELLLCGSEECTDITFSFLAHKLSSLDATPEQMLRIVNNFGLMSQAILMDNLIEAEFPDLPEE